jgi:hypothetical protein
MTKATDPHSEYVTPLLHRNNGYANAPQIYVYTYIACLFNIKFGGTDSNQLAVKS